MLPPAEVQITDLHLIQVFTDKHANFVSHIINCPQVAVVPETMNGSPVKSTVSQGQITPTHPLQIRKVGFLQVSFLFGVVSGCLAGNQFATHLR